MSDLNKLISNLSSRKVTRKQFIISVTGGFFGMFGIFRLLDMINTPDNPNNPAEQELAYGEMEYGGVFEIQQAKQKKEDEFSS